MFEKTIFTKLFGVVPRTDTKEYLSLGYQSVIKKVLCILSLFVSSLQDR